MKNEKTHSRYRSAVNFIGNEKPKQRKDSMTFESLLKDQSKEISVEK